MKFSPAILQRKLHRQLLSSLGVSLLLGGIAAVSLTYITIRHQLKDHILEQAQAITRGLEFASEGLIETRDLYLLERLVQNYATLPAVLEISIVDPEGILIAHSDAFEVTSPNTHYADLYPELAHPLHQASFNGIEMSVSTILHGKRVVVHLLPFSSSLYNQLGHNSPTSTNQRGVAIAVMDLQHMERNVLRSILSATLMITISASVILVLMGYLIQRLILAPVTRIHTAILQSDYETHFSLPNLPNNEIGFLGKTLTSAFQQLKTYQQLELETAERNYRAIAQRYELATHATKVWVWDWDRETDIFNIDQGLQQGLGHPYPEGGCPLHSWVKEIYPDDRDLFVRKLQACLAEETSELSCEYRLQRGDCTPHWFLSRGKAVRDGKGDVLRVIGTLTDITERKQVEAQLSQTNEELRCATRLKDEFLANMSHELRTPLNAILGMTEALQEGVYEVVNSQQAEALETIERSGFHLLELINDILDVAKIESGQMVLEFAPTSIQRLCQFSLSVIYQQAQQKSIQIQVRQPPDLPVLLVDERRIRQVLINLLNNAVKFTPKGGYITLEITSPHTDKDYLDSCNSDSCEKDKMPTMTQLSEQPDERGQEEQTTHPPPQSFLRIAVIDTGIGISPENIKKLFQPFIQIDSALNRRYEGTGLGLALVKRIVELHHGKVGVTSELGVGSCFTIELPCDATTPVISDTTSPSKHTDEATSHKPKAPSLILLIEDNEANIFTISNYLRARGDRILSAQNGQEGIALARSEHPDLILMSIHLPGMNGLEAIRILRRDPTLAPIPIIALADLTVEGDRDRCLAAGATAYLSKPVKLKQLAALIQQLLPEDS